MPHNFIFLAFYFVLPKCESPSRPYPNTTNLTVHSIAELPPCDAECKGCSKSVCSWPGGCLITHVAKPSSVLDEIATTLEYSDWGSGEFYSTNCIMSFPTSSRLPHLRCQSRPSLRKPLNKPLFRYWHPPYILPGALIIIFKDEVWMARLPPTNDFPMFEAIWTYVIYNKLAANQSEDGSNCNFLEYLCHLLLSLLSLFFIEFGCTAL